MNEPTIPYDPVAYNSARRACINLDDKIQRLSSAVKNLSTVRVAILTVLCVIVCTAIRRWVLHQPQDLVNDVGSVGILLLSFWFVTQIWKQRQVDLDSNQNHRWVYAFARNLIITAGLSEAIRPHNTNIEFGNRQFRVVPVGKKPTDDYVYMLHFDGERVRITVNDTTLQKTIVTLTTTLLAMRQVRDAVAAHIKAADLAAETERLIAEAAAATHEPDTESGQ